MLRCNCEAGRSAFAAYMHCHGGRSLQSSVFLRAAQFGCGGVASRWGHSAANRGRRGRQVEVPACKKSGAKSRQLLLAPSLRVLAAAEISIRRGDIIGSSVARFGHPAQQHSIKRFHPISRLFPRSRHPRITQDLPPCQQLFVKNSLLTSEVAVGRQQTKCETEPIYS
ncbi:hypothetical protein L1887_56635 [Cichorium endivia]|nr:hypothetical protein L1887_56635 [Cichorium endivia]